ncbi:MAG: addiction module protein [Polyangiaceae bacterium]|jgi:hypothetical protein
MAARSLNGNAKAKRASAPKRRGGGMTKAQQTAARTHLASSAVKPSPEGITSMSRELEGQPDPAASVTTNRAARGLDAAALQSHARSMSPRVRAVLDLVSELTEDERSELRAKLGGDELDETEWTAAWNDELSHRMAQIERGEVKLLTREEFWADDD